MTFQPLVGTSAGTRRSEDSGWFGAALHLKMMRLLFLCLLLLLPTTTAASDDVEGSADGDVDDEDLNEDPDFLEKYGSGLGVAGSMGDEERADNFIMVVIVVAVAALTLSVAAIVTVMLVRRHMRRQQQGVYSVPVEQHQKGV
ncbi:uncharacterized protein si:dkey-262k9.2 isoform X2 [Takifugu flavidus]|uniref:uncharacterized protein si:dkey-262k9.2 isoform X2 n=1 Tax=Takifugu flavidus TaxID=433684 RepID=UPI002544CE8B|nr:uncharacterized protein si:dkey-262k9.2 isoform X2 [Takifugu flavidus]